MSTYALDILQKGFQNLTHRKGSHVNVEEMETEVNYQTCRFIIKNHSDKIVSTPVINNIKNIIHLNINP